MKGQLKSRLLARHSTIQPIDRTSSLQTLQQLAPPSLKLPKESSQYSHQSALIQQILQMKPKTAARMTSKTTSRSHKTQSVHQLRPVLQLFATNNCPAHQQQKTLREEKVYKFLHIDSRINRIQQLPKKQAMSLDRAKNYSQRANQLPSQETQDNQEEQEKKHSLTRAKQYCNQIVPNQNSIQIKASQHSTQIRASHHSTEYVLAKKSKLSIKNLNPLAQLPPKDPSLPPKDPSTRKKQKKQLYDLDLLVKRKQNEPGSTLSTIGNFKIKKRKSESIPEYIKATIGIEKDSFFKIHPKAVQSPSAVEEAEIYEKLVEQVKQQPTPQERKEVEQLIATKMAFIEKNKRKTALVGSCWREKKERHSSCRKKEGELAVGEICGWENIEKEVYFYQ